MYIFKTPVVCLRKMAVFARCTWLYVEDYTFVQEITKVLLQYMKTKHAKIKTTYFNFPDEVVIKDVKNIAVKQIGEPCDVTDKTEVVLTFTLQCKILNGYTFITPVLKTVKYVYY